MKTYKIKNLNVGFAFKKTKVTSEYSEIVAVHNASGFARLGGYLIHAAIELGGKYLECFGGYLNGKLYAGFGFEVYKTLENVKMRNGKIENLYFMKLRRVSVPISY
jgi:hypothetical protein